MPPSDFHVQWHITNKCLQRCIHCYQDTFTDEEDLDFGRLCRVADHLAAAMREWGGACTVTLTGGEPFLKDELFPLLRYLDCLPEIKALAVITNGLLFNESIADELKRIGKFTELLVSLDAATLATNAEIRGPMVFNRVTRNLRVMKGEGLKIALMATLMRDNLHELPHLLDAPGWFDLDGLVLERFVPLGAGRRIATAALRPEEVRDAYRYVFEWIGQDHTDEELLACRALRIDFDRARRTARLSFAGCAAGKYGAAVMPEGTVLPCRRLHIPAGNLLQESLADIWNRSKVLRDIRDPDRIQGKCRRCPVRGCTGCRAIAYALSGDYLAEDPQCWREPERAGGENAPAPPE
jgi:MoaA/NifB/PqqE/SkfB family radical SAM enzyme